MVIYLDSLDAEGRWPPRLRAEVLAWVAQNRDDLMKEWKKWHK